jgi:DNA repair exonuclease SbcCD ATPase subunit
MIVFTSLKFKNFLSTGNAWTDIKLDKSKSTLIVGQNGAGKSTMLDAIAFGLFGKPHRNINKPQLINTINNKNCIVEVTFVIGKAKYKIIRGIKPNVFEIWKNGDMINQSSHSKEYQKILEQNILKLNHKSFHQIVVLGSSSFVPFMQLPAQHRRDVIEDLLDINVFSKMNTLLKEKTTTLKDKMKDLSFKLDVENNKIETQKKYISDIKALNNSEKEKKDIRIKELNTEVKDLQDENTNLSQEVEEKQKPLEKELNRVHDKRQSIVQYQAQFRQQMSQVVKDSKFYEDNETCPTCSQDISNELRSSKLADSKAKAKELKEAMDHAFEKSTDIQTNIDRITDELTGVRSKQSDIHSNNQAITRIQNEIQNLETELNQTGDIEAAKEELEAMRNTANEFNMSKFQLNEDYSYNNVMSEMLKDTGIKTKIIKQYIPVINKLVNQYLQILDFYVHFDLDESFTETIRSRHRDQFSYDSFSEGEKQRIDLALLFTWRMIAKMKNSISTNLLLLDETFDSSLDHDGVENLMKILHSLDENSNTFIISHKGDILDGKFKDKIEFVKEKNFSKIKDLQVLEDVI